MRKPRIEFFNPKTDFPYQKFLIQLSFMHIVQGVDKALEYEAKHVMFMNT